MSAEEVSAHARKVDPAIPTQAFVLGKRLQEAENRRGIDVARRSHMDDGTCRDARSTLPHAAR